MMRVLSPDEKNTIKTLQLMLSLQDTCKKLRGDMKDYPVNTYHQPRKEKSLWLAFAQALNNWEQELFGDAIAEVGSQNFIEAAAICKKLSKIKCEANTESQLGIAEYLGLTLHERAFGLSFRHNTKAIIASDIPGLVRAIDLAIPEALAYVDTDCLNQVIVMLNTKKIVKNIIDYELFIKVIDVIKTIRQYREAKVGYRCARMQYLSEEYTPLGMPDEPTTDEVLERYESLLSGFRVDKIEARPNSAKGMPVLTEPDAYLRPAMRDLGIGSMPIPETDEIEIIDETVSTIERAFFEMLVRLKTHETFIGALAEIAENGM